MQVYKQDQVYDVFPSFRFRDANTHRKNLVQKLKARGLKCFDPKEVVKLDTIPGIVQHSKVIVIFGTKDYGENTVDSSGYNTFDELVTACDYEEHKGPTMIVVKMFEWSV